MVSAHMGMGLAAKKFAPSLSLGLLLPLIHLKTIPLPYYNNKRMFPCIVPGGCTVTEDSFIV